MRIVSVTPLVLSIPFDAGGSGEGIMPTTWNTLDFCLVRIETDKGLVGWGEGFGYFCSRAVAAIIERSIAPLLVGQTLPDPRAFSEQAQRRLVLQGRYGITTFALSGVDIALWDLVGKSQGVPIAKLLDRGIETDRVPAYASLVRYGDAGLVCRYAKQAIEESFPEIKLHEITMPEIRACRQAVGEGIPLSVDVNCNWSLEQTRQFIPELIDLKARWLEEPIFPPEDFPTLASLRSLGLPIATGENACTAFQLEQICREEAADFLQPSITKVGGISEFLKVIESPCDQGLMPHSPYFGPGYLATLQMAAVESKFDLFEFLYVKPQAWLYPEMPLPERGEIRIPNAPGLGMDPDEAVIEKYRVD
jgi:L-alanine-DL-glutamate epimerase-like enolase superfamily enzyme